MTVYYDREEFRKYLQDSGAVEAVSRVFLELYELKGNRPKSSIKFIQERISDTVPSLTEFEKLKEDLIAMGGVLSELRTAGKLENRHLAVIDIIVPDTGAPAKVHRPNAARQSQIIQGNQSKHSPKMGSKIRQWDKNDKDYDRKVNDAIDAFLNNQQCKSLLKRYLTTAMYKTYQGTNAANNTTFVDCICTGLDIPESMIGVYAPDSDAYDKFGDLFNPIIKEYHGFDVLTDIHPTSNWGDPSKLLEIDTTNQYIVSTRVRCVRNIENYNFVPKMDEPSLKKLCGELKGVFIKLTGNDLEGDWYELSEIKDPKVRQDLIDNGYILEYGDKFLESAGAINFWPNGRAVYINKKKTFFVWINEEDHMRFISMEAGSEIANVYARLKVAVETIENAVKQIKLNFRNHKKLGFVSLCPTNLGNTIRASVTIKIPKLLQENPQTNLQKLAQSHDFEIRPGSASASDTVEISNKKKIGIVEIDTINGLFKGITAIINAEKNL